MSCKYCQCTEPCSCEEDICGLCGEPGADKIPHPVRWPGEKEPDTDLVHSSCEAEECARAHAAMTTEEREKFLFPNRWNRGGIGNIY